MLGAKKISTLVVGIIELNDWMTLISTGYLRIFAIDTSNTLGEIELTWIWRCPILWLPIGILCGVECRCEYTFAIMFLNWMDE
jgi:hypothetical protein